MLVLVDWVVVVAGVLARVPVEDELAVVEFPDLLLLLDAAEVALLDRLLLLLHGVARGVALVTVPGGQQGSGEVNKEFGLR